jgi:uncharacterized repeat protein (TIGR03803 family)
MTFTQLAALLSGGLAALSQAASAGSAPVAPPAAGAYTVFATPAPDQGYDLRAPVIRGPDGALYTVARYGGPSGKGSVLRIAADGTVTVLHAFATGGHEGKHPEQALMVAADGWLVGTTSRGGGHDLGTVFKVSTDGQFVVLHSFGRHRDRGRGTPTTPLVQDAAGNLYGGVGFYEGAIYRLAPDGQFSIVHYFSGKPGHETYPSGLVLAANGLIYGTTRRQFVHEAGTIFSIQPDSGQFQTLHRFDCRTEGCGPDGTLVAGPDEAIYGVGDAGGRQDKGTVWRFGFAGDLGVLHVFTGDDPLGYFPVGGLVADDAGTLYGATEFVRDTDAGGVFSMTRDGVGTLLHLFDQPDTEGYIPGRPTPLPGGMLYGTTEYGGPFTPGGVVYRMQLAQ